MIDLVLARPGLASKAERHWSLQVPLGLGYLAASARNAGFSVAVVDAKLEGHLSTARTVSSILSRHPRYIGLSAMTVEVASALSILQEVKNHRPEAKTVFGGVHANALPSETIATAPEIDNLLAGEGETSIVDLLREKPIEAIAGLHRRAKDGSVVSGKPARYDEDVEALPIPAWDLFPPVKVYPIMATRGCPFRCTFCSHNMGRRTRRRSVDHVMEEIGRLVSDHRAEKIVFIDETFGLYKRHTEELLDRLITFNRRAKITFEGQTRVEKVTRPMMQKMKEAGFVSVELGVESGDESVLRKSNKGTSVEQIRRGVRIVRESGVKVYANFIIGLPGETRETIRNSIDLAAELNPHRLSVATIVAYPGSDVYRWALNNEHGYRLRSSDWQRFDKYLSNSVEIESLTTRELQRYQAQMYLETYLRNGRVTDLSRLLWRHRSIAKAMAGRFLGLPRWS